MISTVNIKIEMGILIEFNIVILIFLPLIEFVPSKTLNTTLEMFSYFGDNSKVIMSVIYASVFYFKIAVLKNDVLIFFFSKQ